LRPSRCLATPVRAPSSLRPLHTLSLHDALPISEKVTAPPQPTRSITAGSSAQVAPWHCSAPPASDRANTPPLPEALRDPVTSASGNGSPFPSPAASWIKNTSPAPTMPSRVRVLLKVPEVDAYCSVQPSTLRSS